MTLKLFPTRQLWMAGHVGTEGNYIALGGTLIELAAAVVVVFHAVWALSLIVRGRGSDAARLVIAQGVLSALGFSLAGTLLKTIGLQSFVQIRSFAFVFVLRTVLKQVFQWEQRSLEQRIATYVDSRSKRTQM